MSSRYWFFAVLLALIPACDGDNGSGPDFQDPGGTIVPAWTLQNPRPHSGHSIGMVSLGPSRTLLLTRHDVVETDDDGSTWQSLGLDGTLFDIHRRGDVVSVLTSEDVYLSTDNAMTWRRTAPHGIAPRAVAFFDTGHGIVVGLDGGMVMTDDGGSTWVSRVPGTSLDFADVEYLDEQTIFVAGESSVILRTRDNGDTWNTVGGMVSGDMMAIGLSSPTVAVSSSDGDIYISRDEGDTWNARALGARYDDIDFLDSLHGIACGREGSVRVTVDGGNNWTPVRDDDGWYQSAGYFGTDELWVAGAFGVLLRSRDRGGTWQVLHGGARTHLLDVSFASADVGIAVGTVEHDVPAATLSRCGLLYTRDGGKTWRRGIMGISNLVCVANDLRAVRMLDTQHAVAVGDEGDVWTTDDGGASWTFRDSGTTEDLHDVAFVDEKIGIAVGNHGVKRHTDDGGMTWSDNTHVSGTTKLIRAVSIAADSTTMFVGNDGTVRRAFGPDRFWTTANNDIPMISLADVVVMDLNHAVIVGTGLQEVPVFYTTDGGGSWDTQMVAGTADGTAGLGFTSASHGYLVMDEGGVHITEDGGVNWRQGRFPALGATTISAVGENTATAVGYGGLILRTTSGAE